MCNLVGYPGTDCQSVLLFLQLVRQANGNLRMKGREWRETRDVRSHLCDEVHELMKYPLFYLWLTLTCSVYLAPRAFSQSVSADRNWAALHTVERRVVSSRDHEGNVFQLGERVSVPIPEGIENVRQWRVADEMEREIGRGELGDAESNRVELGDLPVGWYWIGLFGASGEELGWTTAAVLAPQSVPTPQDSPICVDSAVAWFAENDPVKQEQLTRLAALAGVNWVRDRMRWRDVQPSEGELVVDTTYDSSATIQNRLGLKVLQVYHDTPRWAVEQGGTTGRFPEDLRHVFRFAKAMAQRYKGRVQAWEPWNEANVATFGGHTMDEICSYQKAAYLGFKAGDAEVTVCWNATTAVPTERQTDALLLNETWSYFDTYNIHTYDWADEYERLWAPARRAACGKPLWITESDRGMKSEPSSPTHDFSAVNRRLKAQYVTQSYVKSLHAGANRHFHFILGQYGEGETQFGLLRHDMTPQPGYVALAGLGRFLAGARCIGRLKPWDTSDVHIYGFRSQPDGVTRDVIVAWTERNADWPDRGRAKCDWQLPEGLRVERCFDYLGREIAVGNPVTLTSSPIFLVLPEGQCEGLPLTRQDESPRRVDAACPVVLQCALPRGTATNIERIPWASEYEYAVEAGRTFRIPIYVYNFGSERVRGSVRLETLPPGCEAQPMEWSVELEPMGRAELAMEVMIAKELTFEAEDTWLTLRGGFEAGIRPVLAFRLAAKKAGR